MAPEKVRQMCIQARQGSESARNELVREHLGLVMHVAGYFHRPGYFVEFGDLVQQGCLGVLHAIEKYDPMRVSRGRPVRFSTYAHYWICHCIRREIQDQGGCTPSLDDREWLEDGNGEAAARLIDPQDDPEAACRRWDARRQIEQLLARLAPRSRKLLRQRYGLAEANRPLNQKEVAVRMGISAARVGTLERASLHQLHRFLFPSE
jgi:RNA polymerase sigma factor (sigma-70 family)